MKVASNRNVVINDENQKPAIKKEKVDFRFPRTQSFDEYSDPSDLDISIDFEPDVAYGEGHEDLLLLEEEEKTTMDEYKPMIIANLLDTEEDFMPLDTDLVIKPKNKFILIDWITRIHGEFGFTEDTLISAVDLFCRISKARKIKRCFYQLFAATSLWIASKLEETQTPALSDFIYLCNDAYKENEFIECEKAFCSSLKFDFYGPTARSFILAITSKEEYSDIRNVAEIFLNVAMLAEDYSITQPSVVAVSCVYLAILSTAATFECFDETEELTGIDPKDVCDFCVSILATYAIVFEKGTDELKDILLKKISELPIELPKFDVKFVKKINEFDLISLQ